MGDIHGDINGVSSSTIEKLKSLYDYRMDFNQFISHELLYDIASITSEVKKEIAVYIDRRGYVMNVSVGTDNTAPLPKPNGRKSLTRTNGIRCIHTHPDASSNLSQIDLNSLHTMNFDAMAAVSVKSGRPIDIRVAIPTELYLSFDVAQDELVKNIQASGKAQTFGPFEAYDDSIDRLLDIIRENDQLLKKDTFETGEVDDRAILVAIELPSSRTVDGKSEVDISLDELEELTYTAGGVVLRKISQKRNKIDPAYMIGKGKLNEISIIRQSIGANLLIFDRELTGTQVRNIQELTGAKVLDRTNLILDIFAGRAKSKEGKLQVELAQLKYTMPQLMGLGKELSRQGGGIGTRGPGETMLETDRRHIERRINSLESQLETVKKQRKTLYQNRRRASLPLFALVGYTNAGKSTLLNQICDADVFVEDKLFATLDPSTRRFKLPYGNNNAQALMTDTVGFIRNLPHHLVEAFKSTLEQAVYADVILHVVDASSELAEDRMKVVESILKDLGAHETPRILVLNKIDLPKAKENIIRVASKKPWVEISAATGKGIDNLLSEMANLTSNTVSSYKLFLPYKQAGFTSYIYEHAFSVDEKYTNSGIEISLEAHNSEIDKIKAQYDRLSN